MVAPCKFVSSMAKLKQRSKIPLTTMEISDEIKEIIVVHVRWKFVVVKVKIDPQAALFGTQPLSSLIVDILTILTSLLLMNNM